MTLILIILVILLLGGGRLLRLWPLGHRRRRRNRSRDHTDDRVNRLSFGAFPLTCLSKKFDRRFRAYSTIPSAFFTLPAFWKSSRQ